MRNHPENIAQLPTRLNVDEAWAAYQKMALLAADDFALRADAEFCQTMLRAWKRWSDLFIATDVAA